MASLVPTEVLHKIAECLPTSDIPSFRLTSFKWAEIGLEYFLPEVHLILSVQSFDRLKQISLHPQLSGYIRSIFYESDHIVAYTALSDWADAHRMWGPESYSLAEIEAGWQKYREVYRTQEKFLVDGRGEREVREALLRFPRLASIRISNSSGLRSWTPYFLRSFQCDSSQVPVCGDCSTTVHSLACSRQITSIVEVLMECPTYFSHLRILNIGIVSWEIFLNTDTLWWKNDTLALLEEVKVILSMCGSERDDEGSLGDACRDYLEREETLLKFLSPMRHLNKLDISFDLMYEFPFNADYAIGVDITWPKLREITIGNLSISEDNLISFIERHVQTLSALTIKGLMLDEEDEWGRTLRRIRDMKSWEKVAIRGFLHTDEGGDWAQWIVEEDLEQRYVDGSEASLGRVSGTMIDEYIFGRSQDNPLTPYH